MPKGWLKRSNLVIAIDDIDMKCSFPELDVRFPSEPLQDTIDYLLSSAFAPNTELARHAARTNFIFFLHTHSLLVQPHPWSLSRTLPAEISTRTWIAYHAFLFRAKYKWNTIINYSSQVKTWLISLKFGDPTLSADGQPDFKYWAIHRSIKAKLHGDKKDRFPITFSLFHQLYLRCLTLKDRHGQPIEGLDQVLADNLWFACTLMFFGLLRTSEIHSEAKEFKSTECSRADLHFEVVGGQCEYIETNVKNSKTKPDPARIGFTLRTYPTSTVHNPIIAAQRVFAHDRSRSKSRPLLDYRSERERTRNDRPRADRSLFTKWVTALLKASGIDDLITLKKYTSHSFRSGAASELAKQNFSEARMRLAGRWQSDAVRTYIENVKNSPDAVREIITALASSSLLTLNTIP